jgi:hypothetical protein
MMPPDESREQWRNVPKMLVVLEESPNLAPAHSSHQAQIISNEFDTKAT